MVRRKILSRAALVLLIAVFFVACDDDVLNPPDAVDALFNRYVAIGNSLTAGFQSGGINDSTQLQSYAVLLAQQFQTEFEVPLLNKPGCPPPLTNIFTQETLGGPMAPPCAARVTPIHAHQQRGGAGGCDHRPSQQSRSRQ